MSLRRPSRPALGALAMLAALGVTLGGCAGDDGASPTTVTAPAPGLEDDLEFPAWSDPGQVVTIDTGRRFAIALPADPARGWRWVVGPVDTTYLVPLGTEFVDDQATLAQVTTTTTVPPPEDPGPTTTLLGATTTSTTTEPPETTTTTAPGPLVQVMSFAGRAGGLTEISVRYERIGATEEELADAETLVFQVLIGTPPPPAPEGETDDPPTDGS